MAKPPVAASLTWAGDLKFTATSRAQQMTLDGHSLAGPSPVQALAFSIAGCMAMDVIDILRKSRHPVVGFDVAFDGLRAESNPHRFTDVKLTFVVRGVVPEDAVRRAITLSREKYCSVSNSLRQDIAFVTEFEVRP
jgi:putative redox protein